MIKTKERSRADLRHCARAGIFLSSAGPNEDIYTCRWDLMKWLFSNELLFFLFLSFFCMSERLGQSSKVLPSFSPSPSSKVEYREINLFWKTDEWEKERERPERESKSFFRQHSNDRSHSQMVLHTITAEIKAEKAAVIITGWVRMQKRLPKYQPARSADEGF